MVPECLWAESRLDGDPTASSDKWRASLIWGFFPPRSRAVQISPPTTLTTPHTTHTSSVNLSQCTNPQISFPHRSRESFYPIPSLVSNVSSSVPSNIAVTRVTKDRSAHCGKKSLARQAVRILTGGPQGRHLLRVSTAWRKWAGKYTKFMQRDVRITAQMESTIQTWGGSLEKTPVSPPSMNFVDEHDVAAANPSRKNLRSRHFASPRGRF